MESLDDVWLRKWCSWPWSACRDTSRFHRTDVVARQSTPHISFFSFSLFPLEFYLKGYYYKTNQKEKHTSSFLFLFLFWPDTRAASKQFVQLHSHGSWDSAICKPLRLCQLLLLLVSGTWRIILLLSTYVLLMLKILLILQTSYAIYVKSVMLLLGHIQIHALLCLAFGLLFSFFFFLVRILHI